MIGIIPAAGLGTRFGLPYSKSLLPIGPKSLVIDGAVQQMTRAGCKRIVVVLSRKTMDVAAYLEGLSAGAGFTYAMQSEPRGLLDAVAVGLKSVGLIVPPVLFAMPDTLVEPPDALKACAETYNSGCCDCALGTWRTSKPSLYGTVKYGHGGVVVEQREKRGDGFNWMWGCAAWGSAFADAAMSAASGAPGASLGLAVDFALSRGMRVAGVQFHDGRYADLGSWSSYEEEVVRLSEGARAAGLAGR
jgi:GTP:adenosylcobinamide-phosphate guanylyltransferase